MCSESEIEQTLNYRFQIMTCCHWPLSLTITMARGVQKPLDEIHRVFCRTAILRHIFPIPLSSMPINTFNITGEESLLITHHGNLIYVTLIPSQMVRLMSRKHISNVIYSILILSQKQSSAQLNLAPKSNSWLLAWTPRNLSKLSPWTIYKYDK